MRVPAAMDVGIGGVGVVVGIDARAVGSVGAVAAEEAHVIHERVGTGLPECADSAVVDAVGVKADAGDDVVAAAGRFKQRHGRAGALEGSRAVEDVELRHAGVQADEDGVRLEVQRIADDVAAFGDVEDRVLVDRFLNGGGIVTDTVTFYAERTEVDPAIGGREGTDDVAAFGRERVDGLRVEGGADLAGESGCGDDEAVGVRLDEVVVCRACGFLFAHAQQGEERHVVAGDVFEIDFGAGIVFVADGDGGAADVLEA